MQQLTRVAVLLGLFVFGETTYGNQKRPEERLDNHIILHFQVVDIALEKLDHAVTSNRLKVCDKKVVSGYFTQARAQVKKILKLESSLQQNPSQEPLFVTLHTALDEIIAAWSDKPESLPSDKKFELCVPYVTALEALLPYLKNYDEERLQVELDCPNSSLIRSACAYLGVTVAVALCILNPKQREHTLQQISMLDTLLELLKPFIAADKIKVSNKKAVSDYLTRMHEILQWPLSRENLTDNPQLWRPFVEPIIAHLIDSAKDRSIVIQTIRKELARYYPHLHNVALTEPFIDASCLIAQSLGMCEAAVFGSIT